MKVSTNLLSVIKNFEQFRAKPYKATNGETYFTAGYGHYGPDVDPSKTYDMVQALKWLDQDVAQYENAVNRYAHSSINQGQFDALVDMAFNMGSGFIAPDNIIGDFDDFVRAGDWAEVRRRIPQFRMGTVNGKKQPLLGLIRRRAADVALFDGKTGTEAIEIGRRATF